MRNLAEVRIRVSAEVFELVRTKLQGIIEELDNVYLNVLPSKDFEITFQIPSDDGNMENFEDLLDAYRLLLRYARKLEGVGTPSYNLQYTRGSFE